MEQWVGDAKVDELRIKHRPVRRTIQHTLA
jgi:hypothetical protein